MGDANRGSSEWWYRALQMLLMHWRQCVDDGREASQKRVRRRMAIEYVLMLPASYIHAGG